MKTTKPFNKAKFDEAMHPRGKGEHGGEWIKKLSDSMDGLITGKDVPKHVPSDGVIKDVHEADAIMEYTGGGYEDINGHLRFGDKHEFGYLDRPVVDESIKGLDAVFEKIPPLERPVEVKRGVSNSNKMFGAVGSRVGKEFTDKGYVSTTHHASERYGSIEFGGTDKADLSIVLPKGAKGFQPITHGQFGDKEGEVLLPRGSRFKVVKDFMDGALRRLELELVL